MTPAKRPCGLQPCVHAQPLSAIPATWQETQKNHRVQDGSRKRYYERFHTGWTPTDEASISSWKMLTKRPSGLRLARLYSVVEHCGTLWIIVELLGFRVLCLLSSIDSRDASAGENKFVRFATSCGTGSTLIR